jgi:hypothetical protein
MFHECQQYFSGVEMTWLWADYWTPSLGEVKTASAWRAAWLTRNRITWGHMSRVACGRSSCYPWVVSNGTPFSICYMCVCLCVRKCSYIACLCSAAWYLRWLGSVLPHPRFQRFIAFCYLKRASPAASLLLLFRCKIASPTHKQLNVTAALDALFIPASAFPVLWRTIVAHERHVWCKLFNSQIIYRPVVW